MSSKKSTATYDGQRVLLELDGEQYTVSGEGARNLCMECLERDLVTNTNWHGEGGKGYFTISKQELDEVLNRTPSMHIGR